MSIHTHNLILFSLLIIVFLEYSGDPKTELWWIGECIEDLLETI
jgi:hypothetical protein